MYIENNGAVPILSGVGLDVEDNDHNEVFMMQVEQETPLHLQCAVN